MSQYSLATNTRLRQRWLYNSCAILAIIAIICIAFLQTGRILHTNGEQNKPSQKQSKDRSRVLLVSYMRGGSSFIGDIFNVHDQSFYWFEPLDGVYSSLYGGLGWQPMMLYLNDKQGDSRRLQLERNAVMNSLFDLLNCNLSGLPVEVLLSRYQSHSRNKAMSQYHRCAARHPDAFSMMNGYYKIFRAIEFCSDPISYACRPTLNTTVLDICYNMMHGGLDLDSGHINLSNCDRAHFPANAFRLRKACMERLSNISDHCLFDLLSRCKPKKARVVKVIRFSMTVAEDILARDPAVKFIHYVRDPRGIIRSRNNTNLLFRKGDEYAEADLLCAQMKENAQAFNTLREKYPNNFLMIRYEDLAIDTQKTAEDVLTFSGLSMSVEVKRWVKRSTKSYSDGEAFQTKRANSKATALAWKKHLSKDVISYIDEKCEDVYSMLGYEKMDILDNQLQQ